MTVETEVRKVTYPGNGLATNFSFEPFTIYQNTDNSYTIQVTLTDDKGVETEISEGTGVDNYALNLLPTNPPVSGQTGSIDYPADPNGIKLPLNWKITIAAVLPLEQNTRLNNQGGYFADTQMVTFDKSRKIDQQQQDELDRSTKAPVSDPQTLDMTLPADILRKTKVGGYDDIGQPAVGNSTLDDIDAIVAAGLGQGQTMQEYEGTGDGTTVAFTLGGITIPSPNSLLILVDGVGQPVTAFSIDTTTSPGNTIVTFVEAPPNQSFINFKVIGYSKPVGAADASAITFLDEGASAVLTTVEAMLRAVAIDVTAHGIDNTGATPISAALNTLNTEARVLKRPLYFPPGVYLFDREVKFKVPWFGPSATGATNAEQFARMVASDLWPAQVDVSFDASADVSSNTINAVAHGLTTGWPLTYKALGGSELGLLDDENVYWAIRIDNDNFQVAATKEDAEAATPVPIAITAGSGTQEMSTRWMMVDFFDGVSAGNNQKMYMKNFRWSAANRPGVRIFCSTSPGGGGGNSNCVFENIAMGDTDIDTYAIEGDSAQSESGMLTGSTFINLNIRAENAMKLGPNMDDVSFICPRFFPAGNDQGSETLPFLDLNVQNVRFIACFIGGIGPTGYTVTSTSGAVFRPIIKGPTNPTSKLVFDGLFFETTKGTANLTHIFDMPTQGKLEVRELRINVDNVLDTARAVVLQRMFNSGQNGSIKIESVTQGSSSPGGNPFPHLVESLRSNQLTEGPHQIDVYFDDIEDVGFADWPFTCLRGTAGNHANVPIFYLHGTHNHMRYDGIAMTENTNAPRRGIRLRTEPFDASAHVNPTTDLITIAGNQLMTGQTVMLEAKSGSTVPVGTTDLSLYWVYKDPNDADLVGLCTSESNAFAGTLVDITAVGSGNCELIRMHKMIISNFEFFGSTWFTGASVATPDSQTLRLPGAGTYLISVKFSVAASAVNQAVAHYIVNYEYASSGGAVFAVVNRLEAGPTGQGTALDVIISAGPTGPGDITFQGSWSGGGSNANRWQISVKRLDQISSL